MNKYEQFHKKILDDIDSGKRTSPLKAVRAFCLECVGYKANEVVLCTANNWKDTRCPLYGFRFGKNETGEKSVLQISNMCPNGLETEFGRDEVGKKLPPQGSDESPNGGEIKS